MDYRRAPLLALSLLAVAAPAQARMTLGKPVDPCWLLAHQASDPSAETITVVNQAGVNPTNLCRVESAIVAQSDQLRRWWHTPIVPFGPNGWPLHLGAHIGCAIA